MRRRLQYIWFYYAFGDMTAGRLTLLSHHFRIIVLFLIKLCFGEVQRKKFGQSVLPRDHTAAAGAHEDHAQFFRFAKFA